MFQKGDYLVYGTLGVCRVRELTTRKFEGLDAAYLYYVLEPLYQDGVLYIPAENPNIPLRPVISAAEANSLIDALPQQKGQAFHSSSTQELTAHYEEAMRTHNCKELFQMVNSLYEKKQGLTLQKKKFGRVDEHFMRRAEDFLYGELAVALNLPKGAVPGYIAQRLAGSRA